MFAYKFVSYGREEKPDNDTTKLLEKAMHSAKLTREEKDTVASALYGLFGSNGSTYRLLGWAWPMSRVLPRILVRHKYDDNFHPYYAPDKTSLRKALSFPIQEMIYA